VLGLCNSNEWLQFLHFLGGAIPWYTFEICVREGDCPGGFWSGGILSGGLLSVYLQNYYRITLTEIEMCIIQHDCVKTESPL